MSKGFTLLELMIAIAIIAILAAVLVPNFMRMRNSARLSTCLSNTKNLATLLENFNADYSRYPDPSNGSDINDFIDNYMGTKIFRCPARKTYYTYDLAINDGAHFVIGCKDWSTGSHFFSMDKSQDFSFNGHGETALQQPNVQYETGSIAPHKLTINGSRVDAYPVTDADYGSGYVYP